MNDLPHVVENRDEMAARLRRFFSAAEGELSPIHEGRREAASWAACLAARPSSLEMRSWISS